MRESWTVCTRSHASHMPDGLPLINDLHGCRRIFQVNEKGSVPVLKDLKSGKWLASSEEIVDVLEDKYPEPALGKADSVPEA